MESTLSIQLSDLALAAAHYLGFGRTPLNWTGWKAATPYVPDPLYQPAGQPNPVPNDSQLAWIMESVQGGYREFLYPELVEEGAPVAYEWSFLTPRKQFQLVAGQTRYDLADEFRDLVGEFTFQPLDIPFLQVKEVGIGEVERVLQSTPNLTSKPQYCAIVPKVTDGALGQRYEIWFAPIPDSNYVLDGRWSVLPQALTNQNPYPYGGMVHGPTIVAAVKAYAERHFNDEPDGPMRAEFVGRLKASIAADREFRPQNLGYCADRSDGREGGTLDPWSTGNVYATQTVGALFNGVQP